MDLREKITSLISVCCYGAKCEVLVEPFLERGRIARIAWEQPASNEVMSGHGATEEEALAHLWETVQRHARFYASTAESTLGVMSRQRDAAARDALTFADRLASIRRAMRDTGANPRDPYLLHDGFPPPVRLRSKIAEVWGWCFDRRGVVQTEASVCEGKPSWRHAWIDDNGDLALHGYGATDEEALANLWLVTRETALDFRAAREAQKALCCQRIIKDQGVEITLKESLAEIDRIMAYNGEM